MLVIIDIFEVFYHIRICCSVSGKVNSEKYNISASESLHIKNTCIPVVDSFWYLAKLIQFCKV